MLDKIRPTSCGLDMLPDWFLRMTAPSVALPLSYLFNLPIQESVVPSQWKTSSITPVKLQSCQEYRPISNTPILSRLMEKEIVRSFILYTQCVFTQTILIRSMTSSHLGPQGLLRQPSYVSDTTPLAFSKQTTFISLHLTSPRPLTPLSIALLSVNWQIFHYTRQCFSLTH